MTGKGMTLVEELEQAIRAIRCSCQGECEQLRTRLRARADMICLVQDTWDDFDAKAQAMFLAIAGPIPPSVRREGT